MKEEENLQKPLTSETPLEQPTQPVAPAQRPRYFGLDVLRVLSCYMVMQVHAGEFYYIGEDLAIKPGKNPFWVAIYNSLFRSCVPLFVMISGYLLLPVKTDLSTFLKTRFTRVLFPFIFWCACYSFYYLARGKIDVKQAFINLPMIFVNYGTEVGHLWYIYMLIGVYLFAPIITPWVKEAPMSQWIYYLTFWGISMVVQYIHLIFPLIWGECSWNNTPTFQSFTGHFGYAVLGAFIKIHLDNHNLYILAVILIVVGYAITTAVFIVRLGYVKDCVELELSWNFHSINVAMETFGIFLLLRKLQCKNATVCKIFSDISLKSYGMYLVHIMFLDLYNYLFNASEHYATIFIPVLAILAFISSYIAIKLMSYIPYSKYLIG